MLVIDFENKMCWWQIRNKFRKPTSGSNKCCHPHQKCDLNFIMSTKYFTSILCFQFRDLKVTNSCALNKTKVRFLIVWSIHFGSGDDIREISKMLLRLSKLFLCLEFGTNQMRWRNHFESGPEQNQEHQSS